MKKVKRPEMTLEERFANTVESLQKTMGRIAQVANLSTMKVYAMYREYQLTCQSYDQSAVMGEFIEWYRAKLGGNRELLDDAIGAMYV